MAEDRWWSIVAVPTPEGPAFCPFGSWGRGYVIDALTRATLETFSRRMVCAAALLVPLTTLVGRHFGIDASVAILGVGIIGCSVGCGAMLFILRKCRITATRVTSEDLLRRAIEQRGRGRFETYHWCGLVLFGFATVIGGLSSAGIARIIIVAVGVAWVSFIARQLWRFKRLDVVPSSTSGP